MDGFVLVAVAERFVLAAVAERFVLAAVAERFVLAAATEDFVLGEQAQCSVFRTHYGSTFSFRHSRCHRRTGQHI